MIVKVIATNPFTGKKRDLWVSDPVAVTGDVYVDIDSMDLAVAHFFGPHGAVDPDGFIYHGKIYLVNGALTIEEAK